MNASSDLPRELADIAATSRSLSDFGQLVREWNHFISRSDVTNRPAIAASIRRAPEKLTSRFALGGVADAYLAAYAEWLADQAHVDRPNWVTDAGRRLEVPWFADNARASLLILAPGSFRQRNVFTIPEKIIRLRRGRPRVSGEQKQAKARQRNRRYRERQKQLIELGRQQLSH